MKIYTVLCIVHQDNSHEEKKPEVIVSNYTELEKAKSHFADYREEDESFEDQTTTTPEPSTFDALNTVLDHFCCIDNNSGTLLEEVFLIETEEDN